MFSPTLRFLLVFLTVGAGIRALMQGHLYGAMFILGGMLLAAGHFLYGSVRAAFMALKRGNLKRAHQLLHRSPTRWLTAETRAYYHWTAAALSEARGEIDTAIEELERALTFPLRTTRDVVLARGTVAALWAKKGNRDKAIAHLDEADALGPQGEVAGLLAKIRADL
ncbi:MAG: hypothetical protein AAGE52_12190 [Myxococcota bacterium]